MPKSEGENTKSGKVHKDWTGRRLVMYRLENLFMTLTAGNLGKGKKEAPRGNAVCTEEAAHTKVLPVVFRKRVGTIVLYG